MKSKTYSYLTAQFKWEQLFWLFKAIVVLGVGYIIVEKMINVPFGDKMLSRFYDALEWKVSGWMLVLSILLVGVNWALETRKWQWLLKPYNELGFVDAFKSVLMGISLGIFTPGRVGEYGGRMVLVAATNRWMSLYAHFVSSLSQNLITLSLGALAAYLYIAAYFPIYTLHIAALSVIILVLLIPCAAVYYQNENVFRWIKTLLPNFVKSKLRIQQSFVYGTSLLHRVLLYSLLRYLVFCLQYGLLLYFFGIEVSLFGAISGIGLIYLIQSGIPLPPFLSMIARGEIAIAVWAVMTQDAMAIMSATFTLWLINLLFPAICGAILLLFRRNEAN